MFHEVATLMHLMESLKREVRAEGIRLILQLEEPSLLEGRPCVAIQAMDNMWRDKAAHDKKIAGDFVLISSMSLSRLCRLDKGSSRGSRCFLRPAIRLGMTLVVSRTTGEWRYAAHTAHTVRLPDIALCRAIVCNSRINFSVICRGGKKSTKRDIKCCNSCESERKTQDNYDP